MSVSVSVGARMIGRDGGDRSVVAWLALAHAWRRMQVDAIEAEAQRVAEAAGLPPGAPVVVAGCGAFLAEDVAQRLGRPARRFASVAGIAGGRRGAPLPDRTGDPASLADWADVCAPAVAVALALAGTVDADAG